MSGSNRNWILSDSRSSVQQLSNWHKVGDNTRVAILEKLKHLSSSREIHLQWVPSHVNIAGNEIADSLAKDGAAQPTMNSAALTYSELHSTYINNNQSTVPPAHHWYQAKQPETEIPPIGVVWLFGERGDSSGVTLKLDHGSKLRGSSRIALALAGAT
ncbi:RNase H domain-containing protein [Trichonephila clavipes]|nr:RNase H domain-containing protein [Trichonephila clavipes]